jgi:hypothetical protein
VVAEAVAFEQVCAGKIPDIWEINWEFLREPSGCTRLVQKFCSDYMDHRVKFPITGNGNLAGLSGKRMGRGQWICEDKS